MSKCQRCGDMIPPQVAMCPRCGAPVSDPRWAQSPQGPARGFGQGPGAMDAGMWQAPQAGQAPQFSAGALINEDNLPDWMRQAPEAAQGGGWAAAAQQRPPQQPASPQGAMGAGWGGAPAGWQGAPQPAPLESQQTIRQPAVGPQGVRPGAPVGPQGSPSFGWQSAPQAPAPQAPYDQRFAAPPAAPAYPPGPAYPGNPNGVQPGPQGYAPYAQTPYGQTPYAQAPYAPQAAAPQPYPPAGAFPPVEQVGAYGAPPPQPGMIARGFVDQSALPPWLAGAAPQAAPQGTPLGMQARSLVDEQALPEWLRQQPEERPRPTVAGWLGSSATDEPPPPWAASAGFSDAAPGVGGAPVIGMYTPPGQAPAQGMPGGWQGQPYRTGAQPISEDLALPGWLQAQAGAGAPQAQAAAAYPQDDWGEGQGDVGYYQAPPGADADAVDIAPPARAPTAETWGAEPLTGGADMDGSQEWQTPQGWDETPPAPSTGGWDESAGRRLTRGAPLSQDEMPPWLRGGADRSDRRSSGGERANAHMAFAGDDASWGAQEDAAGAWDDRRDWNDEGDGWGDQRRVERGGYDERQDAGWDREYDDESRGRGQRDSRSYQSGRPDSYGGGDQRWADARGRMESPQGGYGESERPYAGSRDGRDMRESYDPGDPYADGGYYGAGDDYGDERDERSHRRKGWRGFFNRGE